MIFGIGDGEELSQDIEKVNVEKKNGETIYTIHYKDMEGERWSLTLIYSTVSAGTIKLKNNSVIWEKVKVHIPTISAAHSNPFRPPIPRLRPSIPTYSGHPFRGIPATLKVTPYSVLQS